MPRYPRWQRRQATRRGDTPDGKECLLHQHPEHFQICVHIFEARRLTWSFPLSGTSYVLIGYGKKKRRTTMKKNMVEPVYRESFVFETHKNIRDLEQSSIWLGVMEPKCCGSARLMGEGTIDIGSIWALPNHQVNQKWIQLSLPTVSESVGFLKVGIIIIYKGDIEILEMQCKLFSDNNYESNNQSSSGLEQQKANYQFTIFSAFSLTAADRRVKKPLSTFVRVTFCGLVGKTAVRYHDNNPAYNEQISMVELFPNTNQKVCFEVCVHEGITTRILVSTHLNLGWISHDGENGFLPTFGPSLLHMYGAISHQPGTECPYHQGALLVSLKTVVPFDKQKTRTVSVEPVPPKRLDTLWVLECFCIYCPILEVSMIDGLLEGKCGVAITIGEMFNQYGADKEEEGEFNAMLSEIRGRKLNYLDQDLSKTSCTSINLSKGYPVLQLAAKLPDFRFRMYRNNIVKRIESDLSAAIDYMESQYNVANNDDFIEILNNALDQATAGTQYFMKAVNSHELKGYATELDNKQLALMRQEIEKIHRQLSDSSSDTALYSIRNNSVVTKKDVKMALMELKCMFDRLESILNKNPHGWPDILVWVISGGVRVACHRVPPADILYSHVPEQSGRHAGSVQTLYLKPIRCPKHHNASSTCCCITAKIELQLWMGMYKQYYAFEDSLPQGYKVKLRGYNIFLKTNPMIIESRVFIYSAKLSGFGDTTSKTNVFVRIHAMSKICETIIHPKSSLLTWNQVLKSQLESYTTQEKLTASPPDITVDVLETTVQGKENLIGRVNVRPIFDDRQSYEYAPKLRSYELYRGTEHAGEILMSAQLLQVPEKLVKTTLYTTSSEIRSCDNYSKDFTKCSNFYEVEVLPPSMLPQMETYKIDIKWWGLRDLTTTKKPCVVLEINNLTVKSDVVLDKKANCNFPNGHSSYTFEAPLSEPYCPPLIIRLYDCSTFGRTLFLGANSVKNLNKFRVNWISVNERERLLKGKGVTSTIFYQANHVLYMMNNKKQREEDIDNINNNKDNVKISKWKKFISRKQPKEEEYTLLPIFDSEQKPRERTLEKKDWWQRYFYSKIYSSELENQPEFSKFRDWCFNLKFYNNEQKLARGKDTQDCYGSLKAGIAIYNWPPEPEDTVAVSMNGVDLRKGYFSDYPSNDPAKFLVRVYVLKGLNIVSKEYTEKCDPSFVITLGKKRFQDRYRCSQSSDSSTFGEMYELRCTIPEDCLLTLSLYDTEGGSSEELIGKTTIDLEDRIYTKHNACVGLSPKYDVMGPTKWRDSRKPSTILEEVCAKNHLPPPSYPDVATVVINGVEYRNYETSQQEQF